MRLAPSIVISLALLMAVGACGDDAADAGIAASDLEGRTFTATEVTGHDLVGGSEIRITFVDDLVAADAGCNTQRGSYTIEDGELRVGELVSTMMACEEPLMEQDRFVADLLGSDPEIRLDGDQLLITGDTGGLTLVPAG